VPSREDYAHVISNVAQEVSGRGTSPGNTIPKVPVGWHTSCHRSSLVFKRSNTDLGRMSCHRSCFVLGGSSGAHELSPVMLDSRRSRRDSGAHELPSVGSFCCPASLDCAGASPPPFALPAPSCPASLLLNLPLLLPSPKWPASADRARCQIARGACPSHTAAARAQNVGNGLERTRK